MHVTIANSYLNVHGLYGWLSIAMAVPSYLASYMHLHPQMVKMMHRCKCAFAGICFKTCVLVLVKI